MMLNILSYVVKNGEKEKITFELRIGKSNASNIVKMMIQNKEHWNIIKIAVLKKQCLDETSQRPNQLGQLNQIFEKES